MSDTLRILRYNTGTDKKAFVHFKQNFNAVIFNATIVAYSGSSVADLVSMHKRKYIIDPQTHIFQQDIASITSDNKKHGDIKKSVQKYLGELPCRLSSKIITERRPLVADEIRQHLDELAESVYNFQTEYVKRYTDKKDYDKYLKFAHLEPEPRLIIAPYFMLKCSYSIDEQDQWLALNKECIEATLQLHQALDIKVPIAAQLVLDKEVMLSYNFLDRIRTFYDFSGFEYIFIWVDDFNSFEAKSEYKQAFANLVSTLNAMRKKPLMAYGGYESIVLCSESSPYRLYGVAQSVGYGEYRAITPVGGGMPVNKYYFRPVHQRMRFDDAANILFAHGYFSEDKSDFDHAIDYYHTICNCKQCHDIIGKDIHNFDRYNDSTPYNVKTKNGIISRNRPTNDAELIAALHFLYCKVDEWKQLTEKSFSTLIEELENNCRMYLPHRLKQISEWCKIYGCKED